MPAEGKAIGDTSRRPLPLTTVEMQKILSAKLHMSSDDIMTVRVRRQVPAKVDNRWLIVPHAVMSVDPPDCRKPLHEGLHKLSAHRDGQL